MTDELWRRSATGLAAAIRGREVSCVEVMEAHLARIAAVNRASDDFIYYVLTTGVTGTRSELDPALLTRLDEVRARVAKPLAVGFGISKHDHYEALKDRCDAIVVGSAIVRAIADGERSGAPDRAADVVRTILDNAPAATVL